MHKTHTEVNEHFTTLVKMGKRINSALSPSEAPTLKVLQVKLMTEVS